jgi:hypothetical protein
MCECMTDDDDETRYSLPWDRARIECVHAQQWTIHNGVRGMCQVRAAGRHHRAPGRQGTAPRPTPRGGGPVESRVLPRDSGVGSGQCGNARGPRAGPRRRPRDARDRPRRARYSCNSRRTRIMHHRVLDRPDADRAARTGGTRRSSAALSSALKRSVMSTPEKYQSVSNTHAETPTRYG